MFGLFVIEAGKEPVAVLGRDGKPLVYDTGATAASMAATFATGSHWENHYEALKCQPRRISSDAWKARELGRFADGTYTPLPWSDLPARSITTDHFAHVSTEDGAKIAYTADAAKGAGDIQTRIKPGKYLAQFYGDVFDAPTIARLAAEFSTQYGEANVLLFADTAEEIARVYEHGPHSCMAYPASHFDSAIHPCSIYAAGDLAVAYMERNGSITARALVWPAKKLFGRVYGDDTRLCDLLETAAYTSGSLNGARMLRIEEGNGFVAPYVDGCCSAGDNGTHLILGGHGVNCENQNGLSGSNLQCHDCNTEIDEDDCRSDDNGYSYCDDCYSDQFGYCERLEEECSRDDMAQVIVSLSGRNRTQSWGERAVSRFASTCDATGDLYADDLIVTLEDGTSWNQEYFEENGFVCDGSGGLYSYADLVTLEDGTSWSKEHFEANRWVPSPTFNCTAQLALALTLPEMGVGSRVVCLETIAGEFTEGRSYIITRLFEEHGAPRVSVERDDSGASNGWRADRFTLAPQVTA